MAYPTKNSSTTCNRTWTCKGGRPNYSTDPDSLISAGHTVAVEFAAIAAANDYWRT
ncbi:hexameric tyrosine-coordinated heme protein [Actinomycetospora sp.]|uniref:hexameric tyrosine-coordinated heme protein n=1 Tax=Actinomycetospora sp. TaxID=1872135 RepID=UPI0039C8B207